MKMDESLHDLIMAEGDLMRDIHYHKRGIDIFSDEKERITAKEMGNLSDSEYLNDMARYDRLIDREKSGIESAEKELKKVRLQIREYIKMLMSLDEKGDVQ
nr:MAG TPA: hypothetical protein [Caudoviricetes sp.]